MKASKTIWTGRIVTAVPALFLAFDTVIKLVNIPPVVESLTRLGYRPDLGPEIGILEAVCLVLFLVPRTSVVGAVLLTGFLGGAVATHVRVGDPLVSHTLFPIYVAAMIWIGLVLRNPALRAFLPTRVATAS